MAEPGVGPGAGPDRGPAGGVLEPGLPFRVGALGVRPLAVRHDAAGPLAFVVALGDSSLGHATDLGQLDAALGAALGGCDALLLESNYDPGLLREGPYPWSLKERILSPLGHLANADVARYLERGLRTRCRAVVLAHLSQKNNHPELALMACEPALQRAGRGDVRLTLTGVEGCGWVEVGPAAPAAAPAGREQLTLF